MVPVLCCRSSLYMATPPVAQRATLFVPILDDCVILSEPPFLFADLDGTPFTYRGQAEELTHTHALATAQQLTVHISAPTISTFHPHLVQSQQGLIRNVLLCRGSLPTRLNVRLTDNPAMTQTSRWYHEQVTLTLPRDQIQALTVGTVYDETPRSNGDITWFLDRAGRVFANVMYLELHACSGGLPAPTSDPRCPLPPLFPSLKHCVIVHPVSDVVICSLPPYVSRLETLDIQYMKHENTEITPCDKIFTSAHQATQLRSFKTNAVLGGKPAQYLMLYAPNIRELVVGRLGQMLEDSVYLRHIERFTVLRGSVYADMMVRFIRRLDLNVTTIVLPSELKLRVSHRDLETVRHGWAHIHAPCCPCSVGMQPHPCNSHMQHPCKVFIRSMQCLHACMFKNMCNHWHGHGRCMHEGLCVLACVCVRLCVCVRVCV